MRIEKVLVVGAGDAAQIVTNILLNTGNQDFFRSYKVIGYIDEHKTGEVDGIPILGGDDIIETVDFDKIIISISTLQNVKKKIFNKIVEKFGRDIFINVVHSTAYIEPSARIGVGNVIGAFVYIGHKTIIGDNNLISSHCSIEHHNRVGSHCTFAPNIQTSGRVQIDDLCLIGSRIMPSVHIGKNVQVSGNIPIWRDIPDNSRIVYETKLPWKMRKKNYD